MPSTNVQATLLPQLMSCELQQPTSQVQYSLEISYLANTRKQLTGTYSTDDSQFIPLQNEASFEPSAVPICHVHPACAETKCPTRTACNW